MPDPAFESHFSVEVASPDAVVALAETLNRRLAEMQDPNSKSKRGWFQVIAATPTSHHQPLTLTLTTDPNPNPNPNPHQDDMDNAEQFVKFAVAQALEHCPDDLKFFDQFYEVRP